MMATVFLLQILAHILSDFIFQPESWCESKHDKGFRSDKMWLHFIVVLAISVFMTFRFSFVKYAVFIALLHLALDLLKSYFERFQERENRFYNKSILFFIDQFLHILFIYIFVRIFVRNNLPLNLEPINMRHLIIFIGFLLCTKPANVLIKKLLPTLESSDSGNLNPQNLDDRSLERAGRWIGSLNPQNLDDRSLERAGRWIGSIERIIAFLLILLGQFTAIGFIITAKSILRYNASNKTEYVLIGTLMSFSFAILLGIGITNNLYIKMLDSLDVFLNGLFYFL